MENSDVFLGLQDFLERMRQPSASDFVKSIKTFIVSLSNNARDPDKDSAAVQEFFSTMEAAFRAHPLWSGCSEEELESAGEGLEKYTMTKLFTRLFASLPDDVKVDEQLFEKMALIQQFIRPENLDIKTKFQNEASWLLAQKELQKINMCKAPRDKLICILQCCKVINNLLLNASIASNDNPPGADEFLPVLIYVTIKANPPQLHSNLLYIQRFRCQSRLVSEASYYFTNMLSAESFIQNIDANALSMDEDEFKNNMESARALLYGLSTESDTSSNQNDRNVENKLEAEPISKIQDSNTYRNPETHSRSSEPKLPEKEIPHVKNDLMKKIPSLSELENKGATTLLKEDNLNQTFQGYPYLFAQADDLTVSDVKDLLENYKQLVVKYVCLSKQLGVPTSSFALSNSKLENYSHAKSFEEPKDPKKQSIESGIDATVDDRGSMGTLIKDENINSLLQDDRRNQVALVEEEDISQNDVRNKVALVEEENLSQNDGNIKVAVEQEKHVALTEKEKSESELPQDDEINKVALEEEKSCQKNGKDKVDLMEGNSEYNLPQDDGKDNSEHSEERTST